MVVIRFRSEAEAKEMLKKVNKMYAFSKYVKECLEDKMEDDDEDYRDDEDEMMENRRGGGSYRRYRRSM